MSVIKIKIFLSAREYIHIFLIFNTRMLNKNFIFICNHISDMVENDVGRIRHEDYAFTV